MLSLNVRKCNQEPIAAKEADHIGLTRGVPSSPRIDLHAIPVARGTPEQNQGRVQGQPPTRNTLCRAPNETTP